MEFQTIMLATSGAVAVAIAVVAGLGDRRRMRRSDPDAVGFMPWRDVAFWSSMIAAVLLGLAAKAWVAG
ncbi:MAG: hypothetical protein ABIM50_11950 [Novosphingobium sp.]